MQRRALLTIDDAFSPVGMEKLRILEDLGIRAVIFCEGRYLGVRHEVAVAAILANQRLGNHMFDHPYSSQMSVHQWVDQVERTDELINWAYIEAGRRRLRKYFRFPYGDCGAGPDTEAGWPSRMNPHAMNLQTQLTRMGFTQPQFPNIAPWYREQKLHTRASWHWTFDPREWSKYSVRPIQNRLESLDAVRKEIDRYWEAASDDQFDIILMHDHEKTHGWFRPILEHFLRRGIAFVCP